MREIKFRVWLNKGEDANFGHGMVYDIGIKGYQDLNTVFASRYVEFMQYTGLKDKNGKDIYDGDILGTPFGNCKIYYRQPAPNTAYYWGGYYDGQNRRLENIPYSAFEVIGNIYENPELL